MLSATVRERQALPVGGTTVGERPATVADEVNKNIRGAGSLFAAALVALAPGLAQAAETRPAPLSASAREEPDVHTAEAGQRGAVTERGTARDFVPDGWQFQVVPWLWALSINGSTTIKGISTDVDIGFSEIFDQLNFGLFLEAEARHGRFGVFGNLMYADLFTDVGAGPLDIDVDTQMLMTGIGLSYRLGPWSLATDRGIDRDPAGPLLVVDPFVGFRYTSLDVDLESDLTPNVGGGEDWFDPIVGARTIVQIDRNWSVTALGDIGGFGVGSDFTWQAAGLVGYTFDLFDENDTTVAAGYRALGQDYATGSGRDRFEWDVIYHGPILSLAVRF